MLYEIHDNTQKLCREIDKAMTFIIHYLNLPEDVWVDIEFTTSGSAGGCVDTEDNTYLIEINRKQSLGEILATLFHEMKHVEQYATGKLGQSTWLGVDHSNTTYNERPWEKEAYAFESRTIHAYRAQFVGQGVL